MEAAACPHAALKGIGRAARCASTCVRAEDRQLQAARDVSLRRGDPGGKVACDGA